MTAPVKLAETCWCGTHVNVEGTTWLQARRYVATWRREHRHREDRAERHLGFAATMDARDVGIPAARANGWSPK